MREVSIGGTIIRLVQGDITRVQVEAIVNAANSSLLGGGGVDGAIHRAGGPSILEECRRIGGCPPGQARITGAGRLPARYVIHAVGPVWQGGHRGEEQTLASAYQWSLRLAREKGVRSIAFPAISTGAYGYPMDLAARTALRAVLEYVSGGGAQTGLEEVLFVLYTPDALAAFEEALGELVEQMRSD